MVDIERIGNALWNANCDRLVSVFTHSDGL